MPITINKHAHHLSSKAVARDNNKTPYVLCASVVKFYIEKQRRIDYVYPMAKNTNIITKTLSLLAQASTIFYIMPPLMAVLIIGTIAQQSIGLYDAQQKYFATLFFWFGYLPFPGGYLLIGILSLTLLIKFIGYSDWSGKKSGIILTHLGVLILLFGGLLTALTQNESYMAIPEGSETPYIYDYHATELVAFKDNRKTPLDSLPFSFKILKSCDNCTINKREEIGNPYDLPTQSFAKFMALTPKKRALQAEANLSGLTARITGTDNEQDGLYIAFQAMPKPIEINTGGHNYKIIYGKKQTLLPFSIRLNDFTKDTHPGSPMARGYSSTITLIDGNVEWPFKISMNEPLRYKGYTFYQSSFEQTPSAEITILSVVENKGRLFPYIGTLIIALGLIMHLIIALGRKKA